MCADSGSDFDFMVDAQRENSKPAKKQRKPGEASQSEDDDYNSAAAERDSIRKKTANKKAKTITERKRRLPSAPGHNPLLKYFGMLRELWLNIFADDSTGNLGLNVASESEKLNNDPRTPHHSEEDDEAGYGDESDSGPEQLPRTLAIVLENMKARSQSSSTSAIIEGSVETGRWPISYDSASFPHQRLTATTGLEPELASLPPKRLKRKWAPRSSKPAQPSKRVRLDTPPPVPSAVDTSQNRPAEEDDSVTEPEPEPELEHKDTPTSQPVQPIGGGAEDESVTEPEPEPVPKPTQQAGSEDSETVPESELEPPPSTQEQARKIEDEDGSVTQPESEAEVQSSNDVSNGSSADEDSEDEGLVSPTIIIKILGVPLY